MTVITDVSEWMDWYIRYQLFNKTINQTVWLSALLHPEPHWSPDVARKHCSSWAFLFVNAKKYKNDNFEKIFVVDYLPIRKYSLYESYVPTITSSKMQKSWQIIWIPFLKCLENWLNRLISEIYRVGGCLTMWFYLFFSVLIAI